MKKEIAYNYCTKTGELKDKIEETFLLLGERLLKIRQEELYKGQWDSFEEYLESIHLNKSVASRLICVFEKFVVEYGINPDRILEAGGWSDCYQIAILSENKEDAEDWLNKAKVLNSTDLRREITEFRTGKPMKDCKHPNRYLLSVCPTCGLKEKIIKGNE